MKCIPNLFPTVDSVLGTILLTSSALIPSPLHLQTQLQCTYDCKNCNQCVASMQVNTHWDGFEVKPIHSLLAYMASESAYPSIRWLKIYTTNRLDAVTMKLDNSHFYVLQYSEWGWFRYYINNNNNNNTQICTRQCSVNQLRYYELQSIDSLNKQIYIRIWGPESR